MQYLEPLFELPQEIRKCIYTSNAVESVNSALRKVTRGKGAFPSQASVFKVLFLRIQDLTEKWKKPIQNWKTIQAQLMELFGERYTKYLEVWVIHNAHWQLNSYEDEGCNLSKKSDMNFNSITSLFTNFLRKFTQYSWQAQQKSRFFKKYKEQLYIPYIIHTADLKEKDGITYLPIYMTELL